MKLNLWLKINKYIYNKKNLFKFNFIIKNLV